MKNVTFNENPAFLQHVSQVESKHFETVSSDSEYELMRLLKNHFSKNFLFTGSPVLTDR